MRRLLTLSEFNSLTTDYDTSICDAWFERGDGAAIYECVALDSSRLGQLQIWSFGSPEAQLEVTLAEDLPVQLPDTPTSINWSFRLHSYYWPLELSRSRHPANRSR